MNSYHSRNAWLLERLSWIVPVILCRSFTWLLGWGWTFHLEAKSLQFIFFQLFQRTFSSVCWLQAFTVASLTGCWWHGSRVKSYTTFSFLRYYSLTSARLNISSVLSELYSLLYICKHSSSFSLFKKISSLWTASSFCSFISNFLRILRSGVYLKKIWTGRIPGWTQNICNQQMKYR